MSNLSQERRLYKRQTHSCSELKKYNHFWKMNLKNKSTKKTVGYVPKKMNLKSAITLNKSVDRRNSRNEIQHNQYIWNK